MTADPLLPEYPVLVTQQVLWGDMDAHGHVNNVVYYRYMEDARVAYYEAIDKYRFERDSGTLLVLAANACRYRRSLAYPDTVRIGARFAEIGDTRARMTYAIASTALGSVVAEGEATIACIERATGRKTAFPDELRRRIAALQAAR
jgi:acyl-CoA thioester hydrolase